MKRKKATVKTQVKDLKGKETIEHYNAVLLEDMKSQMDWVIEGMDSVKHEINDKMAHLDTKITQEVELLKTVIHSHSDELNMLRNVFSGLNNDVKESNLQAAANGRRMDEVCSVVKSIRTDILQTENHLSNKIDKIGEKVEVHGSRLNLIEDKLVA